MLVFAPAMGDASDHHQVAVASHARDAVCHRRDSTESMKEIRISGILVRRMTYGPPYYGEKSKTEPRYPYWVVKLDYPIAIITGVDIGMPSQTLTVREMQIRRGSGIEDMAPFQGKHVIVQGSIATWVFPMDMTPVVIDGSSIVAGGPIPCAG